MWGPLLVVIAAATGFSFKAIFIKVLYAEFPVDPETLLALRMLFSLPFFCGDVAPHCRATARGAWSAATG